MQIKGKVVKVLPAQVFQSGSSKQTFVLETGTTERPNQIAVDVWKDKVALIEGEDVVLDVNISSREYNGRYFTEVSAWRKAGATPTQTPPPQQDDSSELPF